MVKTKVNRETNTKGVSLFSYSQIRGSVPLHWSQLDGKVKLDRSPESSLDLFIKHADQTLSDYEGDSFLLVNLLAQSVQHEEQLSTALRKLIDDSTLPLSKKGKKVDFECFDFVANYKKCGGSGLMEAYINETVKNMYLNQMELFREKYTYEFDAEMELVSAKHKVNGK